MNLLKTIILIISCLYISSTSFSQKRPFKFGKVSEDEIKMEKCEFYEEANSMILGEFGNIKFIYDDNSKGWKYKMEVEVRKKIFKIADADQGDIKIRVYEPLKGTSKEEITKIKAYTYNLVDGKVIKEKLNNNEFFNNRLNNYWVELSFAIPNIKSGTVIEYSYIKESDYIYNLTTWQFQSDIPSAYSELEYTIPEFFNYQVSQVGNAIIGESVTNNKQETFPYSYQSLNLALTGKVMSDHSGTMESNSKSNRLILKNIPPLEEEPYMNNISDQPSRLQFQLISTNFTGRTVDVIAGNYSKFNQELNKHSAMGERLKNGNFSKDLLNNIDNNNSLEAANHIYQHISNHFSWNKNYAFLSSKAGRPAYNEKEGNVADINLTLIAAFREFNIEAYPVILSTRNNGTVHPIYPSYEEFNYVIAAVKIDGELYLCDAASRLPFGDLPIRCRNGNGWVVSENEGWWVNLKNTSRFEETTMINVNIFQDSIVSHITQKESGYAGYELYSDLKSQSIKDYVIDLGKNFAESEISNFQASKITTEEPITIEYDIIQRGSQADVLYIQPIILGSINENPFTREKRNTLIDFPYSQSYRVISQISIPEGYRVELPEATVIRLPDNQGSYIFNSTQLGDKINITSALKINKTEFSTVDYPLLKQFYQLISEKNQEPIILTK
jgi:hypothetical protein